MSKKQTREEYIDKLHKKNPNIELVGEYIDSQTPVMHKCKIDGYEWMARPSKIMCGQGCPKCGGRVKMTHDEYVQKLSVNNPNVEAIGTYAGSNVAIEHHCLVHDVYWDARPSSMLRGSGCYKCKSEKIHNANARTHEQYVREVSIVNPNVEVVGTYVDSDTPIPHKCLVHNIEWDAHPMSILRGGGCVKCGIERSADNRRKTHEQYVEELKKVNPNIVPIEKYENALVPILHRCLIDGYEWKVTPANILYGKGCPKCSGNIRRTHDEYVNDVSKINPDIEVIEQYKGANTPILHKCKIDGNIWRVTPSDILRGRGCPKCKESNGEKLVAKFLDAHNIEYVQEYRFDDCCDKRPLPFDFYLPKNNVLIEVQGKQHYEPVDFAGRGEEFAKSQFKSIQHHDKIKSDYCKANNIKLLCIPYYENTEETLHNFLFI